MRGYRRKMERIHTTADSHLSIRRLTSCVLIVTDGSYASRHRSDYRPLIDDRALTMAMMGMSADVARMHWPTGGAALYEGGMMAVTTKPLRRTRIARSRWLLCARA
jgi:hypothetical protein